MVQSSAEPVCGRPVQLWETGARNGGRCGVVERTAQQQSEEEMGGLGVEKSDVELLQQHCCGPNEELIAKVPKEMANMPGLSLSLFLLSSCLNNVLILQVGRD